MLKGLLGESLRITSPLNGGLLSTGSFLCFSPYSGLSKDSKDKTRAGLPSPLEGDPLIFTVALPFLSLESAFKVALEAVGG